MFTKLNVGCGNNFVKGWLNVGLFPVNQIPYGKVYKNGSIYALNWDMTKDLMINENSVNYIYSSHFIEHLTFTDAILFFKRCYSVLKPKGVMRLSCPDIELWINNYVLDNQSFFEKYQKTYFKGTAQDIPRTKGQIFMASLFVWGHKWGWDFESLKDILERLRFTNVSKWSALKGSIPDLNKVEPKEKGRVLESLYLEAQKGE